MFESFILKEIPECGMCECHIKKKHDVQLLDTHFERALQKKKRRSFECWGAECMKRKMNPSTKENVRVFFDESWVNFSWSVPFCDKAKFSLYEKKRRSFECCRVHETENQILRQLTVIG